MSRREWLTRWSVWRSCSSDVVATLRDRPTRRTATEAGFTLRAIEASQNVRAARREAAERNDSAGRQKT